MLASAPWLKAGSRPPRKTLQWSQEYKNWIECKPRGPADRAPLESREGRYRSDENEEECSRAARVRSPVDVCQSGKGAIGSGFVKQRSGRALCAFECSRCRRSYLEPVERAGEHAKVNAFRTSEKP